jgi:MFS family permease
MSKAVWASIAGKVFAGWGYNLLLSKMPSYLDTVFGISILENGLYSAIITVATGITMLLGGPLSEIVIKKTNLSRTRVRKIFEEIALIGPGVCIALVPAMGCDYIPVIALLALSQLFYGINTGGEYPIIAELAPDFSGTVFGFVATISTIPTIFTPYVVGVLLDKKVCKLY